MWCFMAEIWFSLGGEVTLPPPPPQIWLSCRIFTVNKFNLKCNLIAIKFCDCEIIKLIKKGKWSVLISLLENNWIKLKLWLVSLRINEWTIDSWDSNDIVNKLFLYVVQNLAARWCYKNIIISCILWKNIGMI